MARGVERASRASLHLHLLVRSPNHSYSPTHTACTVYKRVFRRNACLSLADDNVEAAPVSSAPGGDPSTDSRMTVALSGSPKEPRSKVELVAGLLSVRSLRGAAKGDFDTPFGNARISQAPNSG